MHEKLIAAYDFGTSGCKVALVGLDGTIHASAVGRYNYAVNMLGWAEQDPQTYWDALCRITPEAISQLPAGQHSICAVSMATIWKGIIPLDKDGNVLHHNILWLDGRAMEEAEELRRRMPGTAFSHKDYWPKLLWFKRNEPALYEKTAQILEVNSYLRYLLTGEVAVDLSNHFTRSVVPASQRDYDRFLQIAGLDAGLFPKLVPSSTHVGDVTARAAEQTGLPAGIPVFAGCTDIMAIPVGVGAAKTGDSHIYLGTSGWFGQVTPLEKRKSCFTVAPLFESSDLTTSGLNSVCPSVDWTIAQFYPQEWKELGSGIYAFLEQELATVPAGSMGLLATSWLYGEKPPVHPTARGVFLNIHHKHTRKHFVTAMREAVAYMFRWKRELTEEVSGIGSTSVRAVGGGAQSDHWMQIMANILQIPVELTAAPQLAGTLGAAACAMVGLGELSGFEEMGTRITAVKCFEPQNCGAVYEEMYQAYRALSALNGVFDRINKGRE